MECNQSQIQYIIRAKLPKFISILGKSRLRLTRIRDENSLRISNNCCWFYHTKFESGKFIKATSNSIIFVLHEGIVESVLYTNLFVLGRSRREKR